jgi:outer membrane immunogenic protein
MKRFAVWALGAALSVAATSGAMADGMARYGSLKDAPAAYASTPMWSGIYLGAGLGYGHGMIENSYTESTGFWRTMDAEGMHGGFGTVIVGIDRQLHDRYVVGAFADFDWASIKLRYNESTFVTEQSVALESAWAVGLRAGYLLNPSALLYIAGGYTQADFENRGYYDIAGGTPSRTSISHSGYFVGVGLEAMMAERLSLRGEARYSVFDEEVVSSGTIAGVSYVDRASPSVLSGRLVLTYRIGRESHTADAPLK